MIYEQIFEKNNYCIEIKENRFFKGIYYKFSLALKY
jgi:hypothetical protein